MKMTTITKKYFLTGLCILSLSLFACSDREKTSTKENPSSDEKAAVLSGGGRDEQQPAGKSMVKIIPESPNATTDLQVIYGGAGKVIYRWEKNGRVIEGEHTPMLSKDHFSKGDGISVIVTLDGQETAASVTIGNSPPRVTSVPFSPERVYRGVDITVSPQAFDDDGDYVRFRYKWSVNGGEIPMDAPVLKGDQFKKGDTIVLTVMPYDSDGDGVVFTSKPFIIPNASPVFISSPPLEFQSNTYGYHASAKDPDGDPITYSLASAPQGMTIDGKTGTIEWKINKEAAGTHSIEIVAQDPEGMKAFQKYSLNISIPDQMR